MSEARVKELFLALLELIRQKRVRALQSAEFGPIELHLLDRARAPPCHEFRPVPKNRDVFSRANDLCRPSS